MMWLRYEPDNGKILSVTNEKDLNLTGRYAEIDIFTAKEFIEGTKNTDDYVVVPSIHDPEQGKLINVTSEQIDYDISKNIYQIPKVSQKGTANFKIIQTSTQWQIETSDYLKSVISSSDFYLKKVYNFYITDHNDPNVLLDKFTVKMSDLALGNCVIDTVDTSVSARSNVSVYAYRMFDTYEHVVMI